MMVLHNLAHPGKDSIREKNQTDQTFLPSKLSLAHNNQIIRYTQASPFIQTETNLPLLPSFLTMNCVTVFVHCSQSNYMPADEGDPVSLNQGRNSSSKVSEKWGQPKRLQGLTIIEHRVEEKAMD